VCVCVCVLSALCTSRVIDFAKFTRLLGLSKLLEYYNDIPLKQHIRIAGLISLISMCTKVLQTNVLISILEEISMESSNSLDVEIMQIDGNTFFRA
jgi:hypothetical protein